MINNNFISALLRLSSSAFKFCFVFWLASVGLIDIVADLALSNAFLGLCVFAIPLDYYVTVQAAYKKLTLSNLKKVANHWYFLVAFLALASVIFVVLHVIGQFENQHVVFVIVIFEVLNTEAVRIYILNQKLLKSSILIFTRSSLWVISAIAYYYLSGYLSFKVVLYFWTVSVCISFVYFLYDNYRLVKLVVRRFYYCLSIGVILNSVRKGCRNLISTISIRAMLSFDKYAVAFLYGKSVLGMYQVTLSIISSVLILVDSIIVPQNYHNFYKDSLDRREALTSFYKQLFLIWGVFSIAFYVVFFFDSWLPFLNSVMTWESSIPLILSYILFTASFPLTYLAIRRESFNENVLSSLAMVVCYILTFLICWLLKVDIQWLITGYMVSFAVGLIFKVNNEIKYKGYLVL